jgi:tight adherence protein C
MNELIQQFQAWLVSVGAPTWLQAPSGWIAVVCGTLGLLVVLRMLTKRAGQQSTGNSAARDTTFEDRAAGGVFGWLTPALAAQIPESENERVEFGKMLKQAGFYSPTARNSIYAFRFLFMAFPLFCAGLLAVTAEPGQGWKFLVGGAFVAAMLSVIPRMYVYLRRKTRLHEMNTGLADMLDMLGMCLGGGMPLSASLDHVSKNLVSYPALAEEMQIMRRQSDVGSLKMALADWANRVDTPEVRQVASMLARGDQLGSSISSSLLEQADHFRNSRKQLATLQANRMPVYMTFPLLFCFAPAALIVLMSPSFLQLNDFFDPSQGKNPFANNETIDAGRIIDTISNLDQSIAPPAPPATPE